ncbi:MAG: HEAT repeat domain-containing protein [Bacteroidetes bacterium]|nr:HEAT repeat domain-containing protein [Bacteroidota bacterium]
MEQQRINELIAKYNEGLADPSEIRSLEQLIEEGKVELTSLHELARLDEEIMKTQVHGPTIRLDDAFHAMMEKEKARQNRFSISWPSITWLPRIGVAAAMLVAGWVAGSKWSSPAPDSNVQQLTQQVSELKEMMLLSLLEKESATERLRAVSLTSEMDKVSDKVTDALFQTLNKDPNVNVRLAALDALKPYVQQSNVREGLVRAIALQDSPLVQVSLAELMVAIQEKKSVTELKKLLESNKTPKEVKERIQKSIQVLI